MDDRLSKAIEEVINCWARADGKVSMSIMAELVEARSLLAGEQIKWIDASVELPDADCAVLVCYQRNYQRDVFVVGG